MILSGTLAGASPVFQRGGVVSKLQRGLVYAGALPGSAVDGLLGCQTCKALLRIAKDPMLVRELANRVGGQTTVNASIRLCERNKAKCVAVQASATTDSVKVLGQPGKSRKTLITAGIIGAGILAVTGIFFAARQK